MVVRRFLCALAVALLTDSAALAGVFVGAEAGVGPWFMPYGALPPAIIYDALGRCLGPVNCPDYDQLRRLLDRYQRNYGQRFLPDTPVSEGNAPRRDVAPTPEADVQPAYRGSGEVRSEFQRSGQVLSASPVPKR